MEAIRTEGEAEYRGGAGVDRPLGFGDERLAEPANAAKVEEVRAGELGLAR